MVVSKNRGQQCSKILPKALAKNILRRIDLFGLSSILYIISAWVREPCTGIRPSPPADRFASSLRKHLRPNKHRISNSKRFETVCQHYMRSLSALHENDSLIRVESIGLLKPC
jgi:hypothetical protein